MNDQAPDIPSDQGIEVRLQLRPETLVMVDRIRVEFGLRSRGAVISRLLDELHGSTGGRADGPAESPPSGRSQLSVGPEHDP